MREILFRAKAINREPDREYRTNYNNGDWVYGIVTRLHNERFGLPAEMKNTDGVDGIEVAPDTLGQYTGLTDKNGVKIFEGDVLESFLGARKIISVVKYGAFRPEFFYSCAEECGYYLKEKIFGLYALDNSGQELMFVETMVKAQVIGNIHDNPELLGGDDNA